MKNLVLLSLFLATTTSIVSCSEKTSKKPDAIYRETTDNQEIGSPSSLGEISPPIADSIGGTFNLFGDKKSPSEVNSGKSYEQDKGIEPKIIIEDEPVSENMQAEVTEISALPAEVQQKTLKNINLDTSENQQNVEIISIKPETESLPEEIQQAVENKDEKIAEIVSESKAVPAKQEEKVEAEYPSADKVKPVVALKKQEASEQELTEIKVTAPETAAGSDALPIPASMVYKMMSQGEVPPHKRADSEFFSGQAETKPVDKLTIESKPASLSGNIMTSPESETSSPGLFNKIKNMLVGEKSKDNAVQDTKKAAEPVLSSELPPAEALPVGQCMGKVAVVEKFKEVEESVMVKPAETKTISSPAVYEDKDERVLVSEERTEEILIPAKYKTKEEKVLVSEAQKIWKKDSTDGSVMKLVEEPAKYETVTKKILVEKERKEIRTIPAVYKTVKKRVLVSAAESKKVEIPAVYKTVKKKFAVTPTSMKWVPVICNDQLKTETIKRIQGALIAKGYDVKSVDGVLGKRTQLAIANYQKESFGFDSESVAVKTLDSLGIAN